MLPLSVYHPSQLIIRPADEACFFIRRQFAYPCPGRFMFFPRRFRACRYLFSCFLAVFLKNHVRNASEKVVSKQE